MKEFIKLTFTVLIFLFCYFLPVDLYPHLDPVYEALSLVKWYAGEHVILCLIPAFLIAGAISEFISKESVIRYFGAKANKFLSYAVASISGTILAVCSCTVLPLFSSIYKRGAGIGPAIAFLYSGPAINVLAIILTARILGFKLGLARAVGAILFSIIIGLLMHFIFIKDEFKRQTDGNFEQTITKDNKSLLKTIVFFASMILFIVFANFAKPNDNSSNVWLFIYSNKLFLSSLSVVILIFSVIAWFKVKDINGWLMSSWCFAKQILPLLLAGVFISGLLLGRAGHDGLISSHYISSLVGGNSLKANFLASVVGAFMYFATLTEIPILQGLIGSGMGQGPSLALLLSGPALSLPSMLVIRSVLGTKKTIIYVLLVVAMSTISGMFFGNISG